MSNKDCRPSTLRAVIEAIQNDESLPKDRRTELITGIKTFCRCVGRDPSEVDANPAALRAIARHAKPKLLGVGDAHFRNSMSRLRKALAHAGIAVDRRRNMPLSAAWEAFLKEVGKKRIDLRKFAGSCSARGIEPEAVTQDVFDAYYQRLEEQSIQHNLRERWHRARRAWNDIAAVEGSGYLHIEKVFGDGEKLPSLAEFPASFAAQPQSFREALTKPTIFGSPAASSAAVANPGTGWARRRSGHRRKPLSPVTADGYARNLVLLAGYLVRDGAPVEHLSLGSLLDPELVERGLERIQIDVLAARADSRSRGAMRGEDPGHHDPNEPLPIVTAVAYAVLSLAKYLKPDAETFAAIKAIASSTRVKRKGMTPKNKARLHQLADPRAKSLLLNLPAVVFARHANVKKPTFKQAREVQDAAVLAVLLELPLRMKNVAHLDLERHFQRPVSNGPGKWLISIAGHEVKNDRDINGEFTEETSAMLDRYVSVFRPVLAPQPSLILFVSSTTGKAKRRTTTSTQFSQFIRRETGLELNPHIMRHFAASNWLDAHPDDPETPRQFLGHESIDTTRNFYADGNQRRAFRLYHALTDRMQASSADAPKRTFDFGRRTRGSSK
jgi:integrase